MDSLKTHLNIISHNILDLQSFCFPRGLPTKIQSSHYDLHAQPTVLFLVLVFVIYVSNQTFHNMTVSSTRE